jgi:murein L,D-transpeptidase YafK
MQNYILLLLLLLPNLVSARKISYNNQVDSIVVLKSQRKMMLYIKGQPLKTYTIAIGQHPIGHKQFQGDNRTPEGKYSINDKNPNSTYYLNLGISYPNNNDRQRAKQLGKNPGGDIKIHGYADKYGNTSLRDVRFSSTWGCIAVTNQDMEELYYWVKIGAVIVIKK